MPVCVFQCDLDNRVTGQMPSKQTTNSYVYESMTCGSL